MAQLKVTWEEFKSAALEKLAESHSTIMLEPEPRYVRVDSYEGEHDCYETPEFVYISLKP